MKIARSHFIFVSLLFCCTAVFAQQARILVSGRVIDAETDLPVAHVSIGVKGSLTGTLSDSTGSFHLSLNGKATLYFQMLGYQRQMLQVDSARNNQLTIRLVPKSSQLSEVIIHASPIESVSKSKRYSVLDYAFVKDGILLIVYADPRKAKLLLLSRELDTLAIRGLPSEPNRLFKDCLGNVHVVCSDSIYQTHYQGAELQLLLPKSVEVLEKVLLPCVAQDTSNVYLVEKYGSRPVEVGLGQPVRSNPLALSYVSIRKKDRARKRFIVVADERKIAMSQDEDDFEARKEVAGLNTFGDRLFAETILFTEVCAPLIPLHNEVYVFDFVNSLIRRFDNALETRQEIPVAFHKDLHFQDEVQCDTETQRVYALFETNGVTELKEISLSSGEVIASRKIPAPLVNKVKVLGNYIYFIQKDNEEPGIYFLSRLRID